MLHHSHTLSQEAESSGLNRDEAFDNQGYEGYQVKYTLQDVFAKHLGNIEQVYHETLIGRPTLRKHRDANTLDQIIFIRCPDGITRMFSQKPPSKYAK